MKKNLKDLVKRLSSLDTEATNLATGELDTLSPMEILRRINAEDRKTPEIVARALPQICRAMECAAKALRDGGRLVYVGAGTSGRLGVLDAAECPPTFGTSPEQVVGLISGGYETMTLSKEGVEDNAAQAVSDMIKLKPQKRDFVVGITASRRTPYTIAALKDASKVGCSTALIICNEAVDLEFQPDILISLPVGPEVITGSTRMKSGTVTKMTLNMISTGAMTLIGKTYGNLMVDLQATSDKLGARSRKILMDLLAIDYERADEALVAASGSVKLAILMEALGIDRDDAAKRLKEADGFVRQALSSVPLPGEQGR
ncbi:MAG: N-acetylmuramic acid 6-phosphate etherase [Candidatus Zixiibacteriota bacterium]